MLVLEVIVKLFPNIFSIERNFRLDFNSVYLISVVISIFGVQYWPIELSFDGLALQSVPD